MFAIAEYNYSPQDKSSELALKAGEPLLILNYGDTSCNEETRGWFKAVKDGMSGMVPENYVKIEKPGWYLGRVGRLAAEILLMGCHDGAFLVRLSESSPLDLSLSVKCESAVQHFRILRDEHFKYYLWKDKFSSVNELIEHYRTETLSKSNQITLIDMLNPEEFVVEAKFDFTASEDAQESRELGFRKGNLIIVTDDQDTNWWSGRMGGDAGFFPATYVQRVPHEE